jgi:hypothetical protein
MYLNATCYLSIKLQGIVHANFVVLSKSDNLFLFYITTNKVNIFILIYCWHVNVRYFFGVSVNYFVFVRII